MTKSTKPTIRIHNTELDEVIDREMTDEEFAKYQEAQAYFAAEKVEAAARLAAKEAAQAKLAELGLTVEDLQALGL
jgi:phosphopantetheinyl transferase (holo-ACP synthase)